jgi:uncharacterized protein (DUF1499 family)
MARWLGIGSLVLALAAGAAMALSGLGHRWGWWGFPLGFTILRWAAYAALGAAAVALTAAGLAWRAGDRRGAAFAVAGLIAGVTLSALPYHQVRLARSLPAIHDISTDLDDPPAFVAILPLRRGAANTADYGGPAVAALQRAGYPDIVPAVLALPPEQAFARVLAAARALGWTVVAADPAAGRLEAFDQTLWFGFTDDIVVRVTPAATGSRVDVRSVSRVGKSDVGANARRIKRFLARVNAGT